jgi:hypothetical protein
MAWQSRLFCFPGSPRLDNHGEICYNIPVPFQRGATGQKASDMTHPYPVKVNHLQPTSQEKEKTKY